MNKIGLIAGNGQLPEHIIKTCIEQERNIFVLSFKHNDNPAPSLASVPHEIIPLSSVGKAFKILRKQQIRDVIFAGSIVRPKWSQLRPDATGIKLLARITSQREHSTIHGDNALLSTIIQFFEDHDFNVLGVSDVASELLAPCGVLGKTYPDETASKDIKLGTQILRSISEYDIGQSIIVQQGVVLGIEAAEGTDALIARCKPLASQPNQAILVKIKKYQQDNRIDLPTIGLTTLENIYHARMRGLAIESGAALILNRDELIQQANKLGLFIVGI